MKEIERLREEKRKLLEEIEAQKRLANKEIRIAEAKKEHRMLQNGINMSKKPLSAHDYEQYNISKNHVNRYKSFDASSPLSQGLQNAP